MASEETKDYVFMTQIYRLRRQRKEVRDTQKRLDKVLKKQFKSLKKTGIVLAIYTLLIIYQLCSNMGFFK